MDPELNNFAEAFSPPVGLCRHTCECGTTYYDDYNQTDWEEGEVEKLKKEATALDSAIGLVCFEGKEFAWNCNCWHDRARTLMKFIKAHGIGIASFLNREKERAEKDASALPAISA
ncbi:MAG: hypothetical protein ACYTEQ_27405 [Planctomycetota bacterium]|jgi:hypothetical protein